MASPAMTDEELHQSIFLLGPWLIGSFIDVFLHGALYSQFVDYFTWFRNDKIGIKIAVAGLSLLTTLKTIQSVATVWMMFVMNFTDLERAINLNYTAWWQVGNSLMVASIAVYVQIYYCHRLWNISRGNVWFVLPVAIVLLFAFISACLATHQIWQGIGAVPHIAMWLAAYLGSACAGNLMLTLSIAYILIRSQDDVLPATAGVLRTLVRLTFQTSAPATLCAMFNLIFSQIYPGNDKLIEVAFNQMMPNLFAFSMMWTLNARRSLRNKSGIGRDSSRTRSSTLRRRGDVELSAYNHPHIPVQVHTTIEFSRHDVMLESTMEVTEPSEGLKIVA